MSDEEEGVVISEPDDEPFYDESDQPVWQNLGDH
jgi:hypothetical protein